MAVCRKAYVHPQVLALAEAITGDAAPAFEAAVVEAGNRRVTGLSSDERRFLAFLDSGVKRPAKSSSRRHSQRRHAGSPPL
jgi:DNA topoisomerase IB